MTGYINWTLKREKKMAKCVFDVLACHLREKNPDHIAISGDIVNLSLDSEFAQARQEIEALGHAKDISLVFGNHDVYVPGAFNKACQIFMPWIIGDQPTKHFFPYIRIRNQVAIIGVSSAIITPPFSAAGYFGIRQAQDMGFFLQKAGALGLFRIVMIHHPPLYHATGWNKRLWGIRLFQDVISSCGAELVLHGHTHLPTLSFISGTHGPVPVVGVASASQDFEGDQPPAGYNLFEAGKNRKQEWQCYLTRYGISDRDYNIGVFMHDTLY